MTEAERAALIAAARAVVAEGADRIREAAAPDARQSAELAMMTARAALSSAAAVAADARATATSMSLDDGRRVASSTARRLTGPILSASDATVSRLDPEWRRVGAGRMMELARLAESSGRAADANALRRAWFKLL